MLPRVVILVVPVGLMVLSSDLAFGQDFPNKPIRIVASEPRSSTDLVARVIAQGLTANLGQQVIVENRPAGVIPGEIVSRALPDGYTLLVTGGNLWIGPLLRKTPYDPVRDFSPVTIADRSINILIVHPSLPVKSVKELIALAKTKPGELNYFSSAAGTSNHLAAELFKSMAGVNIVRVPYKSGAYGLNDLMAGEIQVSFSSAAVVMPHVKSGKFRALAVTSAEPSALAPGLPTVAASGLPGYESVSIHGIFAPDKTPAALINRLNQEILRIVNQADVKEKFLNIGIEAVGSSPEQFAAAIKSEMTRLGKLIKDAGIREE